MCGILGLVSFDASALQFSEAIQKASETLKYRGPDAKGMFSSESVLLAHRRLSIIDLSSKANQPMSLKKEGLVIVFNGEIFNFSSLREALIKKGRVFSTHSDTEVLLHLYEVYGIDFISKLNGFFSIALYDQKRDMCYLIRDRYGIKPLYYSKQKAYTVFASELKALVNILPEKQINTKALSLYFHLQYIPEDLSIFKGVNKVKPGEYIEINYQKKTLQSKTYYHLKAQQTQLSYGNAQDKLKTLLDDAVEKRLVSDVATGCFLSGGIDSSIIASIAAKKVDHLQTFSLGFSDHDFFDETQYAELVAEKIKSRHHTFKMHSNDVFDQMDQALSYLCEPFADSSALALYFLAKKAKARISVALSGDGADEVFSGYNKHRAVYKMQTLSALEKAVWRCLPTGLPVRSSRDNFLSNTYRQLKRFKKGVVLSPKERYWMWAGFSHVNGLSELLATEQAVSKEAYVDYFNNSVDELQAVLLTDQSLVLPSDMLVKVDRMSMANSLEVRSPYLDYRIIEFVNTLPSEYKINSRYAKKILRETYKAYLPRQIFERPKKGFEIPIDFWLKNSLKEKLDYYFSPHYIHAQKLFNAEVLQRVYTKFLSANPEDSGRTIWAYFVFQKWHEKYMS